MASESDKQILPREFTLNNISFISADGVSTDISSMCVELMIRQDMFTNYMSGHVMVVDGIGFIHNRLSHGSEYISIDLSEPAGLTLKKTFRIFKIADRETTTANAERYIIQFVSDQMVHSNLKRVSKAYKGITVSKIVEDIFINHLGIDKYTIEKTGSSVDIVIPNWRPTEAINWLSRRAERGGDKFCYMFYENLDGFHFKSLHTIYKSKPLNRVDYVYEPKAAQQDMELNKTTIDTYKAKDFDVLTAYGRGATSMRFIGIDPVHRTVVNNELSIGNIPHMNDTKLIDNTVDPATNEMLYEQYDACRLAHIQTKETKSERGNKSDIWIRHIQSLAMLQHNLYQLTLPGNLQIQVGKLVRVIFPNYNIPVMASDSSIPPNPAYLIMGVTHIFNISMGTFDTVFSVTRDSVDVPSKIDKALATKVRELNEE